MFIIIQTDKTTYEVLIFATVKGKVISWKKTKEF